MRILSAGLALALMASGAAASEKPCPEGVVCYDVAVPPRPEQAEADAAVEQACQRLIESFGAIGMTEQDQRDFWRFCRIALKQRGRDE